uniref:Uncharacterized protein n=1 Tax=Myripristis murdjan TaxID=586833 RepID=A0A667YEY8_9TELE
MESPDSARLPQCLAKLCSEVMCLKCAQCVIYLFVSPSVDKNDSRIPQKISVAKCLYQGCIINQHENHDYNSVPINASLIVLLKSTCPHDPKKYQIKKEVVIITVGCTCAAPDSTDI